MKEDLIENHYFTAINVSKTPTEIKVGILIVNPHCPSKINLLDFNVELPKKFVKQRVHIIDTEISLKIV